MESFTNAVHVPVGYLFLSEPPVERLLMPDFRTVGGMATRPSLDLPETVGICQERLAGYREYAEQAGLPQVTIIGAGTPEMPTTAAVQFLRTELPLPDIAGAGTREEGLRAVREACEAGGVLVTASGIVGGNTHRPLNTEDYRGFSLVDPLAPLIFLNSRDSAAGRIFTLVHELGHLMLGRGGVDDLPAAVARNLAPAEAWCNRVAAELLMPAAEVAQRYDPTAAATEAARALSRHFKVSTLAVLVGLRSLGLIPETDFQDACDTEARALATAEPKEPGGNYYATFHSRMGSSLPAPADVHLGYQRVVEPFRLHYPFEICPEFWDWLDQLHAAGRLRSADAVFGEMRNPGRICQVNTNDKRSKRPRSPGLIAHTYATRGSERSLHTATHNTPFVPAGSNRALLSDPQTLTYAAQGPSGCCEPVCSRTRISRRKEKYNSSSVTHSASPASIEGQTMPEFLARRTSWIAGRLAVGSSPLVFIWGTSFGR